MSDTAARGNTVDTPVTRALAKVLADSYTLYLKTQNYHWNVEGPNFFSLHELFQAQYTALAEAIDDIAERIRALGAYAPGSFEEFAALSAVRPAAGHPTAAEMVADLLEGQQTVAAGARTALKEAEAAGDAATVDLMTQRIAAHDKNAWMLRSILH